MTEKRKDKNSYLIGAILFSVLSAHFVLAAAWQARFFAYFFSNSLSFMEGVSWAYRDFQDAAQGFLVFLRFPWKAGLGYYWPPMVPVVGLLNLLVFSPRWFFLPNFLYLFMAMLGIYRATYFLLKDRWCGLLAATIFSCYWFVTIQLVAFDVQLAAAACVAWGFYAYLCSCSFSRVWPSLWAGFFMVLGLYCDRVAPAVFMLPLFLIPQNFQKKRSWLLMGGVLVLVAACVWPFYRVWFSSQLRDAGSVGWLFSQYEDKIEPFAAYKIVLKTPVFLWTHISYYLLAFTERLMGYGFTTLLVLGLFSLRRLERVHAQTLWIVTGIPLLLFTLMIKKEHVYIFPLCVYAAMISALGIFFLRWRRLRYLLIFSIFIFSLTQYVAFFRPGQWPQGGGPLFGRFFEKMTRIQPPKIFFGNYLGTESGGAQRVRLMTEQTLFELDRKRSFEGPRQVIIVDLKSYFMQYAVSFSMRLSSSSPLVLNAFLSWGQSPETLCRESDLYLLSDKYFKEGWGWSGGCSWRGLEPVLKVSGSEAILYKVIK